MRAVCKQCDLTRVNQISCAKPVLFKEVTVSLFETINTLVLSSCLCILVVEKKKGSKKGCRILVSL